LRNTILSILMSLILRFWFLFIRTKKVTIPDPTMEYVKKGGGYIFAIWHSNMASLVTHFGKFLLRKYKNHVSPLASHSKDGEFISMTVARFGFKTIRGSSSKGGAAGALGLLRAAKSGVVPLITVDGPKGPLYGVKPGVIEIASLSGLPIVIILTSFDRYYEFSKAWDKHRFPKFAARQTIVYSEPILIGKKLSKDDVLRETESLQKRMNSMWEELEKEVAL
jgi:lysophospholipid acyltransferase (LPLAT)-like uncharacterized protein